MSQEIDFRPPGFRPLPKLNRRFGLVNGLIVATFITGANWYFQNQWAKAKINKQDQLIQRVTKTEQTTLEDVMKIKNIKEADDVEGKLIQLTGMIEPGRFIVRRKRGDQEGYIILAPYIVYRTYNSLASRYKAINTKFMINLGWVPKDNKSRIRQTAAEDVIPLDDLPDHLADEQEDWTLPITSTIKAYVRKGEEQDYLTGRINQRTKHVYGCVDLDFFASVFGNVNFNSRFVYFDRCTGQNEEESFPFPKTTETMKQELEDEKGIINQTKKSLTLGVGVLSYLAAFLA